MKTLTLLLSIIITSSLFCQSDTAFTFGLPELKIYQKEKGKNVTYMFDNSLNKFTVTPTFLLPDTNRYNYRVSLNDLRKVTIHNGSNFWNVAGVTGAVGFGLGFLLWGFFDFSSKPTFHVDQGVLGGLVTAIPFALVGGVFGALSHNYDEYDLAKLNEKQKYEALKKIFKLNAQKR